MSKMTAISKRILSQFAHDKRTVMLLLVAPIVVLWLLSVLLGTASYVPTVAAVDLPADYQSVLSDQDVKIKVIAAEEADSLIKDGELDGIISFDKKSGTLKIELEGSDRAKNAAVTKVVTKATGKYSEKIKNQMEKDFSDIKKQISTLVPGGISIGDSANTANTTDAKAIKDTEISYYHGSSDWKMFDFLGPIFIGLFIFVFTFLTSGMSLVNERSRGTMARFLATPIKSYQILGGYSIGFGLLAMVQASLILVIALEFIGFPNEGNIGLVILIAVSLAIASVTLGLLVSGLATNAFQVIQLMLIFVVPQILLCGLFDLSAAPRWLQVVSECLPLTYGVDAMKEVMIRGSDFSGISFDMAIVWGFIVLFFGLAALGYRKKRAR